MRASTYLCLVFLCTSRIPRSVFLVGVYPVLVVLRVSLTSKLLLFFLFEYHSNIFPVLTAFFARTE